ncbi:transposon Tf2-9 polyprotein [Trichonephila clavipes]|nr:transposon Tf2-9 polyprotein [Trichonephila clavipes]
MNRGQRTRHAIGSVYKMKQRGDHVGVSGGVANSEKLIYVSNLFLFKVSETFDECLYDVSHISNSGIRDKVQTLIENYRLSLPEKRGVEKKIDEWLEQGIIRESCSDFTSPVVVCKKKDGTMRLFRLYRKLNKKIIKDRYPLPIIEEVLYKL